MKKASGKFEYKWKSPISFTSDGVAKVIREVLEELDYKYARDKVQKYYDRTYVVMPMFRFAYAFRFIVEEPSEFTIDAYDTQPTHSSVIPYIEIDPVNNDNIEKISKILTLFAEKLPREPWKFTPGQKLMYGYLSFDFRKAKKEWRRIGIRP